MSTKLIPSDAETENFSAGTFLKLNDCPPDFVRQFTNARKAIEEDASDDLKVAVEALKTGTVPIEHCLDVCEMVPPDKNKYPMTLLAYAGYHARFNMIEFLISEGANVDMGTPSSGTPLLQMFAYAHLKQMEQKLPSLPLDEDVVEHFIESGANLGRVLRAGSYDKSTALELAISFQRFDIAKMLVTEGADPILCGDGVISPLFLEYTQFSSHKFVQWLLREHLKRPEIPAFIDRLVKSGVLFREDMQHTVTTIMGKNAAHALLLCGHEEAIRCLVDKCPQVLKEGDRFNRTALHRAAENGDIASVKILLECNSAVDAEDDNHMTPLMLAAKKDHEEVVRLIDMYSSRAGSDGNPIGQWTWALQNGRSSYFEALHRTAELEEALMSPLDNDGNTIAHLAAEDGHVSVFKSTFPKTHRDHKPIFEILTMLNNHNKTPLHLAIDNGHVSILNALWERRTDREKLASKSDLFQQQAESFEKREWKTFWDRESPGLLLYACRHGTVEVVKFFIKKLVSPTTRDVANKRQTPLSCAAEAGKHDIVAYLLSISGVTTEGVNMDEVHFADLSKSERPFSPLMLASKNGHAKCVSLLLEKSAAIGVVSERGYNCLMESIDEGHKSVATVLVSDKTWKKSMRLCVGGTLTPMRMLIEHMPEVAKLVFTKSISKKSEGEPEVVYDFEFIEDYAEPERGSEPHIGGSVPGDSQPLIAATESGDDQRESESERKSLLKPGDYSPLNHPLTLMVKHEQLTLLQHPLIYRYINYKWWNISFPVFLLYLILYILFLIFLSSFALSVPRPAPNNAFCPSNKSVAAFTKLDLNGDDCKEPDGMEVRSLSALAVLLIFMSLTFLVYEIWFQHAMREMRNSLADYFDIVFRIVMFLLTIVFVFGFFNDCWCAPPWQWQIGALSVFMAFFNLILMLKAMPVLGVPINMLLNIIVTFLKLLYLPLLLILSFSIPFYMVFVRDGAAVLDEDGPGVLTAFSTPTHSFAKVIMQTAGELDYGTLFDEASLLYTPMAFILFISFVVLMPILFSNLLVGLAVETTDDETKRAKLTNIQLQVEYIVQLEDFSFVRRRARLPYKKFGQNIKSLFCSWRDRMRGVDYKSQVELVDELYEDTFDLDGDSKETLQVVREKVTEMAGMMDTLQRSIPALERSHKQLQDTLQEIVTGVEKQKLELVEKYQDQLKKTVESSLVSLKSDMSKILKKLDE